VEYDLFLSLEEVDGTLTGALEYNADLFTDDTARRLQGRLEVTLAKMADGPHTKVAELS
jgi:hypothetical protein